MGRVGLPRLPRRSGCGEQAAAGVRGGRWGTGEATGAFGGLFGGRVWCYDRGPRGGRADGGRLLIVSGGAGASGESGRP